MRLVIKAIIKMCAKAILLTAIIGAVIAIIGYNNEWDSSIAYSNAFFMAGSLVIIAGTASRLAGQGTYSLPLLSSESFREMDSSERANFAIEAVSSVSIVILGLLTGTLLILISVIVTKVS